MATNGTVSIAINAEDNSQKGFNSAEKNIKSFSEQIKNMEEKLTPAKALLKDGVVGDTAANQFGNLNSNCTSLNKVVQALNGGFSKLKSEIGDVNNTIGKTGSTVEIISNTLQKSAGSFLQYGSQIATVCTGVLALVDASQKINEAYKTIVASLTASSTASTANAAATATATAASAAHTAAVGTETAANTANAAATIAQTAASAFQIKTIRAQTAASAMHTLAIRSQSAAFADYFVAVLRARAAMTAMQISTMQTAGSQLLLAGTTTATAKIIDVQTAAATRNTIMMKLNAVWAAVCTAAQTAFTAVCTAATTAVNALSVALGMNPITIWIVGITACIAGLAMLGKWVYNLCFGTNDLNKSLNNNADAMAKSAKAVKSFGDMQNKLMDADSARLERLKQLSEKQNKSSEEIAESKKLLHELSMVYSDLGLEINAATGEISGFNDETEKIAKEQMAKRRIGILKQEMIMLRKSSSADGASDDLRHANEDRSIQIRAEIEYYESGGTEDVTGKSAADIIRMRIESEKQAIKEKAEAEKKAAEDAQKLESEKIEIIKSGREFQLNLEKEIKKNNQNALQNELDALREQIDARREIIKLAIAEGKATAETYDQYNRLEELQKQREAQIIDNFRKQAVSYAQSMDEKIKGTQQNDKENELKEKIQSNPFEALKAIESGLKGATEEVDQAKKNWIEYYKKSIADGVIDQSENENLQKYQSNFDNSTKKQDRFKTYSADAEKKIQSDMQNFLKSQKTGATAPITALQQGSADALKQAMENQARVRGEKSPESVELVKIRDGLTKQYQANEKLQKEQNENMKKLVNNVKGIG